MKKNSSILTNLDITEIFLLEFAIKNNYDWSCDAVYTQDIKVGNKVYTAKKRKDDLNVGNQIKR